MEKEILNKFSIHDVTYTKWKNNNGEIVYTKNVDRKEEDALHKAAKEDYKNILKGLDTDGDMNGDEYIHNLREKHREMLSRKFDSDLMKDYVPKKKKTHFRITIDIQEVDDDDEE